ncbi:MAG: WXG100 family type VII secretion target, partial [Clostridia bacterium]|nr:WXG100 family type VII secretion target [Clostridia bacterium]
MANKLLVTPEEVNEKAKAITDVKTRMADLLTEINNRINTMVTEEWIGTAGSAYGNQFVILYNQVIRALDTIQTHANNLSAAAEAYATLENEQGSAVTSLDASD